MTRSFQHLVECPQCGCSFPAESEFEAWFRNEPRLHSVREGIARFDLDLLVHRYRTPEDKRGSRDIQALMFAEVKCGGSECTPAQRDTLHLLSQVLNNRTTNIHRNGKGHRLEGSRIRNAFSVKLGRNIALRLLGGHCLRLENTTPLNSAWMLWDSRPVNLDDLINILTFEVDPHEPSRPMDWRRRYSDFRSSQLYLPFLSKP